MENIFLTSLTSQEVKQLLREELESFFKKNEFDVPLKIEIEQPVTGAKLAEFLHISSPTLIRWRDAGKIPHMRIGGRILYKKSEVLKALEQ